MEDKEKNRRKAGIRGLRKSLEWLLGQDWVTDQTRSKTLDLVDHLGRTGTAIRDELIGTP